MSITYAQSTIGCTTVAIGCMGHIQQLHGLSADLYSDLTRYILLCCTEPRNYLALSIVTLLCCCLPFGLVALIYSIKVWSEYS